MVLPIDPEELKAEVQSQLQALPVADHGIVVERRLEEGYPGSAIPRVARETRADLIVMGTHGRTGLGRMFMGSVAEQVVRKAPCPVLTAKLPLAEEEPVGESAPAKDTEAVAAAG
jgi:nucleotide-binding universal stress UspA family protein